MSIKWSGTVGRYENYDGGEMAKKAGEQVLQYCESCHEGKQHFFAWLLKNKFTKVTDSNRRQLKGYDTGNPF